MLSSIETHYMSATGHPTAVPGPATGSKPFLGGMTRSGTFGALGGSHCSTHRPPLSHGFTTVRARQDAASSHISNPGNTYDGGSPNG